MYYNEVCPNDRSDLTRRIGNDHRSKNKWERISMQYDVKNELSKGLLGGVEDIIKSVAAGISAKVKRKYEMIDLANVPDHVKYSKVERYLRSIEIEITRRMFIVYLKEELLPAGHEVKNSNLSHYTREQIIYFILIDMFKPILPLGKVKVLFTEILSPIIADIGLDEAFATMCEIIVYMAGKFEDAVSTAVAEEKLRIVKVHLYGTEDALSEKALHDIGHYTNLVTLCIAKGALDFYRFSPFALLE
jgi:hypothetical protein